MSVPLSERTQSKVEFYNKAYKLDAIITGYLIRDFGEKKTCRDLRAFTNQAKMSAEDMQKFEELCKKYGIETESKWPSWVLEEKRKRVLKTMDELFENITAANTIYPNTMAEFNLRRNYQWKAIANCQQLEQLLLRIIRQFPVDAEKYMHVVELIQEETTTLRNWKKSDNKIRTKLMG